MGITSLGGFIKHGAPKWCQSYSNRENNMLLLSLVVVFVSGKIIAAALHGQSGKSIFVFLAGLALCIWSWNFIEKGHIYWWIALAVSVCS
jgi:hypothetical protein